MCASTDYGDYPNDNVDEIRESRGYHIREQDPSSIDIEEALLVLLRSGLFPNDVYTPDGEEDIKTGSDYNPYSGTDHVIEEHKNTGGLYNSVKYGRAKPRANVMTLHNDTYGSGPHRKSIHSQDARQLNEKTVCFKPKKEKNKRKL